MVSSNNFEQIAYCYIIKNHHLIYKVDDDFFKNQYIKTLFKLSKEFYDKFKEQIYDPSSPHIGQIEALVNEDKKSFQLDGNLSQDENIKIFLSNVKHVIETDLNNYAQDWLEQTVGTWITWQNSQKGYKLSIQYLQTQNVTPENVLEVISKAKEIVIRRSSVLMDDGEVLDFYDPKNHKQVELADFIDTGYNSLNKFLSGYDNGGFAPGTLNIFFGASNSGKSIILGNIAKNISMSGKNVLFVSLEMSIEKTYKRIGSNVFDVPMSKYNDFSSDIDAMTDVMDSLKMQYQREGRILGKFLGVKFTKAGPSKIHAMAKKLEEQYDIKWHAIVVDYFTELENEHGVSAEKMYIYHKQNANDLFQIAGDENYAIITAHQIKSGSYSKDDMDITSGGESSGILHRADSVIGIISTDQMAIENRIVFKNLKTRDSEYKNYFARFNIDYSKMRLTESVEGIVDPGSYIIV